MASELKEFVDELNVIFFGKVMDELKVSLRSIGVEPVEARVYKTFPKPLRPFVANFFPALALRKEGIKKAKEALKGSKLVIARIPRSWAIASWLALKLVVPKDALLAVEYFGSPEWVLVELDLKPSYAKVLEYMLNFPNFLAYDMLPCLMANKILNISETERRMIRCKDKALALYPPLQKVAIPKRENEGKLVICTSGTYYPHQGFKLLVELIYTVNELFEGENKFEFKLFGAKANAFKIVKALLSGYENVKFEYYKDRVSLYEAYSACDAFLALHEDFKVYPFFGAPAKLADFVLFKKPIIMWENEEYEETVKALTESCECVRTVRTFKELVEEILNLKRGSCECVLRDVVKVEEVLKLLVAEVSRSS